MTSNTPHALRAAVKQTLHDLARLEGMTGQYVNHGRPAVGSAELTRSEFLVRFAGDLDLIRTQLKQMLTSVALDEKH